MSTVRSWGAAVVLLGLLGAASVDAQPPAAKPAPAPPAQPAPPAPAPPAPPAAPAQPPSVAPAAPAAADYKVVTTEPIHAVVLPMKGSYTQHQAAFERLGSYLAGKGISPDGAPFGRYYSDPSVGEDNLVWEVGFKVPAAAAVEAPFELKDIPGTTTVVHVHRGSYEELGGAWGPLIQWVLSNGYQIAGPPTMLFTDFMAPEVELRLAVTK